MAPGMWQILLVVLLAAVLFGGRGKIASVMGDFAKGITSFRKGLRDEEEEASTSERASSDGSAAISEDAPAEARETRETDKAGS
ncbi:MAG: Sec-independent protein translocase TatA [Alphaproteobacteria bacterium]|nr:Sec-independent protein translocase TatA [Alphaproteobacteria bacterium]